MVNDSCLRGHHSFLRMEGDTPFVTANHYSLEHKQGKQCQVQVERTKYPGGRKKLHQKKHGSHMKTTTAELTSSRTQMQRGTPVMVTGSCHLRIEPGGDITVHTLLSCFLLSLPAFTRKHGFPPTKFLHVSQNILPVKKLKSMQRCVFVKCTHCSSFHLLSQFTSKRCTCNSQKKKTFYYHVLFQDSVSVVAFFCQHTSPA